MYDRTDLFNLPDNRHPTLDLTGQNRAAVTIAAGRREVFTGGAK